jgi:hypothetical protein
VHETERQWDFREQKWKIAEEESYEGETDAQGKFVASVNLAKVHESIANDNWSRFENSAYSAYFTDAVTGRTEERRFDLRVTRDPIHVYLIHSSQSEYPHEFYISTDYADGSPAECEVRIRWSQVVPTAPAKAPPVAEERLITRVQTNRYGVAKVTGLKIPDAEKTGEAQIIVDAKDDKGLTGHQTENAWSYYERELGIRVATNKTLYQQGEPIDIELKSSAPDIPVVVDAVHDEKVVASQVIHLHRGRASLVFPSNDNFKNQVTIAAYAFGVHAERDPGESKFASYRNVLFPKNHELNLDVRLVKTTYQPGESVPANLRVSGPDGELTSGAIGLVVVDRAVEERQRADQDLRRSPGFYGYRSMLDEEQLKGISVADLNKLDLSKPVPEGLDLVAEILMQRGSEEQSKFFEIASPSGTTAELFGCEINPQMNSLQAALKRFYIENAAYPKSEATLESFLSREGIGFSALRDPWGMPYRVKFGVERTMDTLEIWTSGPDKKVDTSDDYRVLSMEWPYFKPYSDAITRTVNDYHARTGGYIRDAETLKVELATHGIEFDSLRDPWGYAYRASFDVDRNHFIVSVMSAGPDGKFAKEGEYSYDNFDVASVGINYFEDTRIKIDRALSDNFNKTLEFPENTDEFRKVLQTYGVDWDAIRDPWGHAYIPLFSQTPVYADDIIVKTIPDSAGDNLHHTTAVPVTRTVEWIHIRSEGPGGKENNPRDFEAAGFSHTIIKQSSGDRLPLSLSNQPVLSAGMGGITGTVVDADGKAIVGAQVTAKNSATDEMFMAMTGDGGVYRFRNIPPGHYVLAFSEQNFKSSIITNVSVFSANTTTVDEKLEVGQTSVTVEVSAGLAVLETQSTSVTTVVTVPRTPKPTQAPPLISTPRLRQYFPETLLWQPELITDAAGRAHLSIPLADNITTWKLSAIASTENGEIGTAEKEIRAFQPFFVEHDPPRFLTEGDEIDLPVVLRNYLNHSLRVNVSMKPDTWFVPLSPASAKSEVPASDAATEIFKFRAATPIKNAKQRITATGTGSAPGDAIERAVTVRPNGEEKSETKSQVFDDTASLDLQIPAQALPASVEGELKIYPNLNAHVLESIEAILERPYGCAEQTISSTYPNILLLKYLKNAKNESSPLAPKARRYVQEGYNRLLSYRGEHGGFSYWGKGDSDLALTAYAMRFLQDASEFIEIDNSIVDEQLEWIVRKKESGGRWIASDWYQKEDSRRTMILTAYIARAFADLKFRGSLSRSDKELEQTAAQTLKNALDYLEPKVAETDEPYLIASFALALPLGNSDSRLAVSLDRLRKLEHREADTSYWTLETNTPFFGWGLAGRIETTALVLQALKKGAANLQADADRELLSRGLLFLLKNQDRYGIWYSTQATINVLDALRVMTLRDDGTSGAPSANSAHSTKAEILVDGRVVQSIDLPSSNEIVAPITVDISKALSPGNHHVEIRRAAASTPASVQEITTYYIPWAGTIGNEAYQHAEKVSDALQLSVNFDKTSAKVGEKIQCSVKAERIGFHGYGMMLAEIGLPPGAEVDRESLDRDMKNSGWDIDQYDVLPDRLIVYLWPHAGGTKFTFTFKARYGLKALTTASILYDYYNPEAQATVPPTLFTVRK